MKKTLNVQYWYMLVAIVLVVALLALFLFIHSTLVSSSGSGGPPTGRAFTSDIADDVHGSRNLLLRCLLQSTVFGMR